MKVNVYGMYRSGSSFIYNVVKEFTDDITKLHGADIDDTLTIYSYRDVRNACASIIRMNNMTYDKHGDFIDKSICKVSGERFNISEFINELIDYDNKLDDYNILKIRYEDDILNDNKKAITKILDYISVPYDIDLVNKISDKLDINKQKIIVDNIKTVYDDESKYFKNHIGNGKTNYKDYFTIDDLSFSVKIKLVNWLTKRNYI